MNKRRRHRLPIGQEMDLPLVGDRRDQVHPDVGLGTSILAGSPSWA